MTRILVSACLLGQPVRYDGRCARPLDGVLADWLANGLATGRVIAICPETAAGLPTPRLPAEIVVQATANGGHARRHVVDADGHDLTAHFSRGADIALCLAKEHCVGLAILKEGSPSCGVNAIYDGTFSGQRIVGQGFTATALRQAGIPTFSEDEIEAATACLARLESDNPRGEA